MKKKICIGLLIISLIVGAGCGQQETAPSKEDMVHITVAREFVGSKSDDEIRAEAKEQGIQVELNKDKQTVTYSLTKIQQNELLLSYKNAFEENLDKERALAKKDPQANALSFIKSLNYNDDMSEFSLVCQGKHFDQIEASEFARFLFEKGIAYQVYAGKKREDIDVKVHFVDENKQALYDTTLRESFAVSQGDVVAE